MNVCKDCLRSTKPLKINFVVIHKWYVTWCYRLTGKKSKLYDLIIVSNLESDIDNTLYQIENNGQSSLSAHQKQLFEVAKIIIDNVYDVVHNVGK